MKLGWKPGGRVPLENKLDRRGIKKKKKTILKDLKKNYPSKNTIEILVKSFQKKMFNTDPELDRVAHSDAKLGARRGAKLGAKYSI